MPLNKKQFKIKYIPIGILLLSALIVIIFLLIKMQETRPPELKNPNELQTPNDSIIFTDSPPPYDMTSIIINDTGAAFIKGSLNPIQNVQHYDFPEKKAANLGVYIADLKYCTAFDRKKNWFNTLQYAGNWQAI